MAAQELLRRRKLRASLTEWSREIGFQPAPHHSVIIREIEALFGAQDYDILLIFAPPGSAKSSYVSIALPSWYYGRCPQNAVLHGSHNTLLAEKWGRRNRNLLLDKGHLLGIAMSDDSQAAGRWALKQGGEYLAAGVGVGIAGFRADLGIIDDPFGSRADAWSQTTRDTVWDWFLNDFGNRLKPGAKTIIMHTRWHEDDLAGRVIDEAKAGKFRIRVLSIPAVAVANDPIGRRPGEYLWDEPDGYNYGGLLRSRHRELPALDWAALYQQTPSPDEGVYFKREHARWYTTLPRHLHYYGASDYATTADGGDYTVHIVVGVDAEESIYIADVWRKQTTTDQWAESFCDLVQQYKPLMWAEENIQITRGVGPFLDKRQRERKAWCSREQFTVSRGSAEYSKAMRARSFQGRWSMGKVYLPKTAPWLEPLLSEMLRFPTGTMDDQVDALGLIGRLLDTMTGAHGPRSKEPEKDRYDRIADEMDVDEGSWKVA